MFVTAEFNFKRVMNNGNHLFCAYSKIDFPIQLFENKLENQFKGQILRATDYFIIILMFSPSFDLIFLNISPLAIIHICKDFLLKRSTLMLNG